MFKKTDPDGKVWVVRRCRACHAPFKHPEATKDVACPECNALHNRSKPGPPLSQILKD